MCYYLSLDKKIKNYQYIYIYISRTRSICISSVFSGRKASGSLRTYHSSQSVFSPITGENEQFDVSASGGGVTVVTLRARLETRLAKKIRRGSRKPRYQNRSAAERLLRRPRRLIVFSRMANDSSARFPHPYLSRESIDNKHDRVRSQSNGRP